MKRSTRKKSPCPSQLATKSSRPSSSTFLLEIGSEELPWQMIKPAMNQLAQSFSSPNQNTLLLRTLLGTNSLLFNNSLS